VTRSRRNVLLSSAGRRVSLLGFLQDAVSAYGGRVVATDMSPLSSAFHRADAGELVPRCTDPEFVPVMLDLCERHDIGLVVPTIDTELPVLAGARERFAEVGTRAVVAPPAAIDICSDKRRTHDWLVAEGFPTVAQGTPAEVLAAPDDWRFPLIAKPARGSASIGVKRIDGAEDLVGAADDVVVQALAPGHEYTVDVYVDLGGTVVEAVPRRRIEVRAGEVSKGRTERHGAAMKVARRVAERLDGLRGPMNVQIFCDGEDVNVIEINPRFGGGYPLAHHAGARFAQWLVDETIGGKSIRSEGWTEGLVMLRYDAEVIIEGPEWLGADVG
jgi:carbamoyl-phosphate synthase large subunit